MNLDLKLHDLATPRLSETWLISASRTLNEIKSRNEARWQQGSESKVFVNRKEKMRRRLQEIHKNGGRFWDIQDQVGWQRVLLSIYLDDHGKEWLPPFNRAIAEAILGKPVTQMNPSRRRHLTYFFFRHFDALDAISYVCQRLCAAYTTSRNTGLTPPVSIWSRHCQLIFTPDGPSNIAESATNGERIDNLMSRYSLPSEGRFAEALRQVYLLETLNRCSFGKEPEALGEIESAKEKVATNSLRLGAAALKILLNRVKREGRGNWPEGWQKWIIRLGCDPRLGRSTAEGNKWWGWTTYEELELALRGVIGMSLKLFFDFLDGTVSAFQWQERRKFLEGLFDSGKIIDARLILNHNCIRRLPAKMRDSWSTARLDNTKKDTCIIALRCSNDVYLLEGTWSYSLRVFHRRFPVEGLWERTKHSFLDDEVRVLREDCPICIDHKGNWISKFTSELRQKFHIEWLHL